MNDNARLFTGSLHYPPDLVLHTAHPARSTGSTSSISWSSTTAGSRAGRGSREHRVPVRRPPARVRADIIAMLDAIDWNAPPAPEEIHSGFPVRARPRAASSTARCTTCSPARRPPARRAPGREVHGTGRLRITASSGATTRRSNTSPGATWNAASSSSSSASRSGVRSATSNGSRSCARSSATSVRWPSTRTRAGPPAKPWSEFGQWRHSISTTSSNLSRATTGLVSTRWSSPLPRRSARRGRRLPRGGGPCRRLRRTGPGPPEARQARRHHPGSRSGAAPARAPGAVHARQMNEGGAATAAAIHTAMATPRADGGTLRRRRVAQRSGVRRVVRPGNGMRDEGPRPRHDARHPDIATDCRRSVTTTVRAHIGRPAPDSIAVRQRAAMSASRTGAGCGLIGRSAVVVWSALL